MIRFVDSIRIPGSGIKRGLDQPPSLNLQVYVECRAFMTVAACRQKRARGLVTEECQTQY